METKKQSVVSERDLKLLWRIVRCNWYIPIIFLPLFYLAGRFYTHRLTDIYQASSQIILNRSDNYYQNNVLTDAGFYGNSSYIDNSNELRILSSYDIMQETVSRLKDRLQVSYFIVGRVLTSEQFTGVPFVVKVSTIKSSWYELPFDFKVVDYDNYELSYSDGVQKVTKKGQFEKELIDTSFNFVFLISRAPNLTRNTASGISLLSYQFVPHALETLITQFQANIMVENPAYTNILKISLEDVIPERAVLVLDTLNQVYSQSSLKAKFELNEKTLLYINKQLDEINVDLKNIEDTMQDYKQKNNILNLEWEQSDYFTKLSGYDAQKTTFQLEIEALNDLEKYIIEDKDPQFLPPSAYLAEKGGFMGNAIAELYDMQLKLNQVYNVAKENYPGIADIKQNIKKLKQDLLVYINNSRRAVQQIITNINGEINNYIASIKLIPPKQREMINIQRKVNVSQSLYNFLLEKRANTKIAQASIVPNVKIIESPRNIGSFKPDKSQIIKAYLTTGFFIVMIFILVRSFFFSKIKTADHLKELTELPVIGILPQHIGLTDKGVVVDEQPNSKVSEAFRNFRTNLQYANIDIQSRTFLITSLSPGEGKTFTSVNLATVLAKTGKRVVLMELDLHKPRIFRALEENVKIGISTYLVGQSNFEEIITKTKIDNLWCLFAGPIPPNPSELILSDRMKELINLAKRNFDYIIIDTPPAGILSDAIYLMQYVDASIFVLNTKHATKRVVNFVHDLVNLNNINNMYFLLNGVKKLSGKYYYKGYGYTYGYGYGYGYNNRYGGYGGYGYGGYGKAGYKKKL